VKELPNRIGESAQLGTERKVYLAVDGRTKYRDAEAVLDQIRTSGITQICFLAERLPD
jgi:biopolymer transport protein ExbD